LALRKFQEVVETWSKYFTQRGWMIMGRTSREYAVMLAVILVIVVGSVRLIGSNANNLFSAVSSSLQ